MWYVFVLFYGAVILWITVCTVHFFYMFFHRTAVFATVFAPRKEEWKVRYSGRECIEIIYGITACLGMGILLYVAASSLLYKFLPYEWVLLVSINFGWWGAIWVSSRMSILADRLAQLEREKANLN